MDDDQRDKEDEQPATGQTGRVRIIGAEPAGRPTEEGPVEPATTPAPGAAPTELFGSEQSPAVEDHRSEPELPHWTEAPTGEVPAILSRDPGGSGQDDGDPWSSLPGPTWREERADWAANEETFEPSMLAHDDGRLGSLDDSGASDRQPWTFDLPASEEVPVVRVDDLDTMVVPAVQPSSSDPVRPVDDGAPSTVAGSTVFPETDWAAEAAQDPIGTVDPAESRMARRRGLARSSRRRGRAPVDDGPPEALRPPPVGVPLPTEEPPERPVPQTPPLAAEETGRPVPKAPAGGRRSTPRPRPGTGLRPPEPPQETRAGRNMPMAIVSGVVILLVAFVFFDLGTVTALIISTVVVTLAAVEAFAAFRKGGYHPVTLLGLVATISIMVATYNKGQEALPLILVLLVVFTMLWHLAGVERAAEPIRSLGSTLLVFCWVGVFGSYAALLLNPNLFPDKHGIAFLLGAVLTAAAYDVGALAVGAWIGSHPLSKASPNKTWEGLIGGAVAAVLVAVVVVHFFHPWTIGKAACLGLVVAVVCPLGDLSESLIKRHLGLKDMGRILPGHGGFLDRIDGLLFVLPATYYLVMAFHLG